MIFEVMSERDALAFSADEDILPCAVISIRNPDDSDLQFENNPAIKGILHIKFYDSTQNVSSSISRDDADKVVAFAEEVRGRVEEIVVHCTEGISRSAGVCAALMLHINGSDDEIWSDPHFRPNPRCYRKLLSSVNRTRRANGLPEILGRVYKGLFWFKHGFELVSVRIPCDKDGVAAEGFKMNAAALSENGINYNHEKAWKTLPHYLTEGVPYNYFPCGRVELKSGTAEVYINPALADREHVEHIAESFMLFPECGVKKIRVIADGSKHYKSTV